MRSVAPTPRKRGETRQELGHAREPAASGDAASHVLDEDGIAPERPVAREVVRVHDHAVHTQERLGQRAAIDARGAFLGQRLERVDEAGLTHDLALAEQTSVAHEEIPRPARE